MTRASPRHTSGGNSLGGALRDMLSRGHLMPGVEALRMAQSSLRCSVVDDVYATMRDGSARAIELDRVRCPVLVAWGERDRVLPPYRHARHFGEGIPGVGFRLLPGIGHVPMWDDPALIARTIGDFATAATVRGNGHSRALAGAVPSMG